MLDILNRFGEEHRVFHRRIAFAEFFGNHPHLFAEEIIALVFIHRFLDLVINFFFPAHDRNLTVDDADQHPDTGCKVRFFQQRLFILDLQKQALDNFVIHALDRLLREDGGDNLVGHFGNHFGVIVKAVNQCADHAFLFFFGSVEFIVVINPANLGSIKITGQIIRHGLSLIKTLDHNPDGIFAVIQQLDDSCDNADGINIIILGFFDGEVFLCSQENTFILAHGLPDCVNRLFPADVEVQRH